MQVILPLILKLWTPWIALASTAAVPIEKSWFPNSPDGNFSDQPSPFHLFRDPTFNTKLFRSIDSYLGLVSDGTSVGPQFRWTSVTAFRESAAQNAGTWIYFGGLVERQNKTSKSPFFADVVGVIGCRLSPSETVPVSFQLDRCEPLEISNVSTAYPEHRPTSTAAQAGLLGMGLTSMQLNAPYKGAVLVYCDPLWRVDAVHPGGMCRVRLHQDGKWVKTTNGPYSYDVFHFCTASGHSKPCGGGFSVDLVQSAQSMNGVSGSASQLPRIDLLVGMPFTQTFGEVHLVENILQNFNGINNSITTWSASRRIHGSEGDFGVKVAWTPHGIAPGSTYMTQWDQESMALVASPSTQPWPTVTAYRYLRDGSGEVAFRVRPPLDKSWINTGFGTAMVSLVLPSNVGGVEAPYAVIIGSPFQSHPQKGPNVGCVYITCPGRTTDDRDPTVRGLDGPHSPSYFGFSISRVGDVDGDGIEDVAIGAPAFRQADISETGNGIVGRVYIHRITAQCDLDPTPLQVLEVPDSQPGDGFGVSLTGGVDVDNDGWPELFVTSLESNTTPYIFTMLKRLQTQCQITVPPSVRLATFQAGSIIPVTFLVRLIDPLNKQWFPIPQGLASSELRIHQINPDVLWQTRFLDVQNNSVFEESAEKFFGSSLDGNHIDPKMPRFRLVDDSLHVKHEGNYLRVQAAIQALYASHALNLNNVPLRVAYRSIPSSDECATFRSADPLCLKTQQPLVDWSGCEAELRLIIPICAPQPECSADLYVTRDGHANDTIDVVRFDWGSPESRHQIMTFKVTNQGPTKATGIQIQVRATGRLPISPPTGISVYITEIAVLQAARTSDHPVRSEAKRSKRWIVNVAEDGVAALITSKSFEWMYPNEIIFIDVSLFIALNEAKDFLLTQLPSDVLNWQVYDKGRMMPGINVRILTTTNDPVTLNNEVVTTYQLVYKPRIAISAGLQPLSLIDNRKEPSLLDPKMRTRRVFSEEIGPKVVHTYLIENRGQMDLHNLTFQLDLPIATGQGQPILYLTEEARRRVRTTDSNTEFVWENVLPRFIGADGTQRGSCVVPPKYLNQLNITILDINQRDHEESDVATSSAPVLLRSKRSDQVNVVIARMDTLADLDSTILSAATSSSPSTMTKSFERNYRGRLKLRCLPHSETDHRSQMSSTLIHCLPIHCRLDRLPKHDTVRLRWTGWLWAETFFHLHTPDVQLNSHLKLEHWGEVPPIVTMYRTIRDLVSSTEDVVLMEFPVPHPSFELSQSVLFRGVQPELSHKVPLWPIIMGFVIGSLVLIALGVCCYCGGFFRRQRVEERGKRLWKQNHMKTARSPSQTQLIRGNDRPRPPILTTRPTKILDARPNRLSALSQASQNGYFGRRQPADHASYLVQASPDLYCAEEPEPPSPQPSIRCDKWGSSNELLQDNTLDNVKSKSEPLLPTRHSEEPTTSDSSRPETEPLLSAFRTPSSPLLTSSSKELPDTTISSDFDNETPTVNETKKIKKSN